MNALATLGTLFSQIVLWHHPCKVIQKHQKLGQTVLAPRPRPSFVWRAVEIGRRTRTPASGWPTEAAGGRRGVVYIAGTNVHGGDAAAKVRQLQCHALRRCCVEVLRVSPARQRAFLARIIWRKRQQVLVATARASIGARHGVPSIWGGRGHAGTSFEALYSGPEEIKLHLQRFDLAGTVSNLGYAANEDIELVRGEGGRLRRGQ